jgi:hypothetical protein
MPPIHPARHLEHVGPPKAGGAVYVESVRGDAQLHAIGASRARPPTTAGGHAVLRLAPTCLHSRPSRTAAVAAVQRSTIRGGAQQGRACQHYRARHEARFTDDAGHIAQDSEGHLICDYTTLLNTVAPTVDAGCRALQSCVFFQLGLVDTAQACASMTQSWCQTQAWPELPSTKGS